MEKKTFNLPTMFGDHHVVEVRRILLEVPGVQDVYASSSFQLVEVTYDPELVTLQILVQKLEEAGYLGELAIKAETGIAATNRNGGDGAFRHTKSYEQTKHIVTFAQTVPSTGRPLWPCPGLGPITSLEEET
jgi:copper chaperone CopZ